MMLALAIMTTIICCVAVVMLVAHWADANQVEPSWPALVVILAFVAGALLVHTTEQLERTRDASRTVPAEIIPKVPVKPHTAERP